MRGLIIDDEEDVRDIAAMCLDGFAEMLTAETADEGVRVAAAERPDFILLDVLLGNSRGEDVLGRLRTAPETSAIPVIFLTGMDSADDQERLRRLGATAVLPKPIAVQKFRSQVEAALSGESLATPPASSTAVLDEDVVASLISLGGDDDPNFFSDLVGDYLADAPKRLQAIESAVAAGDRDVPRRESHALKSASGNIGAMAVASAAAALEREAAHGQAPLADLARSLTSAFDEAATALRARIAQ